MLSSAPTCTRLHPLAPPPAGFNHDPSTLKQTGTFRTPLTDGCGHTHPRGHTCGGQPRADTLRTRSFTLCICLNMHVLHWPPGGASPLSRIRSSRSRTGPTSSSLWTRITRSRRARAGRTRGRAGAGVCLCGAKPLVLCVGRSPPLTHSPTPPLLTRQRTVEVHDNGLGVPFLNELEYVDGEARACTRARESGIFRRIFPRVSFRAYLSGRLGREVI